MISSISASPSPMNMPSISSMSGLSRSNAALHSTPNQPVSYSPLIQQESKTTQKTSSSTVNSKDSVEAPNTQKSNGMESQSTQDKAKEAQSQQQVAQVISQLKARDTEVRAHEMAHLSTAGSYARGGMSFSYQTGPDGKQYAVGGEVGIDTSPVSGDPQATLQKAQVIQRAALAPAQPSGQDIKVAAAAQKMMIDARAEMSAANLSTESTPSSDGESSQTQGDMSAESSGNNAQTIQQNNGLESRLLPERGMFDTRVNLQQAMR
ncbi:putative metalloprotease CJM1_0395 family protein [Thiosulfativibrio zosterae]|uniref:SrpA-related protein n=1 Tax=Thiosulfativibrio zosterae TaxID=2675053 RepID=A0A6F8PQ97_9GAMM|nr:putative metalloprotease CJM1_0395 family protein [Thiosulfativibrio zosterae]BBP44170.1 hypothetical protein THMIRHAT_19160 [Thiosulfativibrio zosterae]